MAALGLGSRGGGGFLLGSHCDERCVFRAKNAVLVELKCCKISEPMERQGDCQLKMVLRDASSVFKICGWGKKNQEAKGCRSGREGRVVKCLYTRAGGLVAATDSAGPKVTDCAKTRRVRVPPVARLPQSCRGY